MSWSAGELLLSTGCWARSCVEMLVARPTVGIHHAKGQIRPRGRGRRDGSDGAGDHPVHGRGLRRARSTRPGRWRLAVRDDFRGRRVPGYDHRPACRRDARVRCSYSPCSATSSISAQRLPGPGYHNWQAFLMEIALTAGLLSVILRYSRPGLRTSAGSARSASAATSPWRACGRQPVTQAPP